MQFLTAGELLHTAPRVATSWHRAAATAYSWRVAGDMTARDGRGGGGGAAANSGVGVSRTWAPVFSAFPWGTFLADGAYKSVYKVWNAAAARLEAVSTMDVGALAAGGNLPLIQAEIQCGCLVSELVRLRVCPNFVETYQVFLHGWEPARDFPSVWGCRDDPAPAGRDPAARPPLVVPRKPRVAATGSSSGAREYQYIRMELASGGDVEEHLRRVESVVAGAEAAAALEAEAAAAVAAVSLSRRRGAAATVQAPPTPVAATDRDAHDAATARHLLFQMVFALYAGRERLSMRHYDIKLLNYLLQPAADAAAAAATTDPAAATAAAGVSLRYAFAGAEYAIDLPAGEAGAAVAKLADFGTADVRPATLGGPLKAYHFTTLENAPPEFLLDGDAVRQAYATDTWALGLCAFHLLTGAAPYEEVLADVVCPPPLTAALARVWRSHPSFGVVRCLLECTDGDDDDGEVDADSTAATLANTLFRVAVLALDTVAPAAALMASTGGTDGTGLRAWLCTALGLPDAPPPPTAAAASKRGRPAGRGKGSTELLPALPPADAATVRAAYATCVARFNLWTGTAPLLQRARRRAGHWPGGLDTLRAMMAFHPSHRATAKALLTGPAFAALRCAPGTPPLPAHALLATTAYAADADCPDV